MRANAAHTRADREGDLDEIVDGRLVAGGAQRAIVIVMSQRFQRRVRIEHTAAARAQHVPAHIEQAEPRGMQESGDHLLLVEPGSVREIEQVDAVEIAILTVSDQLLHGIDDGRVGRLSEDCELGLGVVAHADLDDTSGLSAQVDITAA